MARLRRWSRQGPEPQPPEAVDPELWTIFRGQGGRPDPQLLQTADEIRRILQAQPPASADPDYQARLRVSLLREARIAREPRIRPRRFALPLGATLGLAGLAMVAVVVASVVALPLRRGEVKVQAPVAGHHRVPVTQAIRLSFNQPMDEGAVLQGLTIHPAISYQAAWPDPETLVISPAHALAPNVGYVVTIPQTAARAQNGAEATAAIVIPFGTGSAPSTPQGKIPVVVSTTPGAMAQGVTSLSYTPDGALLVLTSGVLQAAATGAPSSSTPSPTAPQASASATPGPATGTLYLLSPSLTALATNALAAVSSPDSQEIAYWSPQSNGSLALEVIAANGDGSSQLLATSSESDPGLAWLDDGDLLYAAAGQLREVSLDGQVSTVDPTVQLDPSGFFILSPSAQSLFARPAGVPTVYSLPSGAATVLPNLVGMPAWSPSSSDLAYVSAAGGAQVIESSSDGGAQSTLLLTAPEGIQLSDLSFDPTGTYLAYVATATGQASQLQALDVQSKVAGALGSLTAVSDPVWAPGGEQLSVLAGVSGSNSQVVNTLLLSGAAEPPSADDTAPNSALSTATSLAQLQVAGPNAMASIAALMAPGVQLSPSVLLPGKFDRFYAVSTTPTGASTYSVDLRLVRDATGTSGPAFLPEIVTVQSAGPSPLITNVSSGSLTPVPTGPLVVGVSATTTSTGSTVFAIQFDSDLDPLTVGSQSIIVRVGGQAASGLQFNYAALTRTETVTAQSLPPGAVTLTVSPPLSDVDHAPIQSPYQVVLHPVPATNG